MSEMKFGRAIGLGMMMAALAVPALAADPAKPQSTVSSFGDWVSRCSVPDGKGPGDKVCEAAVSIAMKGVEGLLAQVVIGKPPGEKALRLIVQLPNGVFLPAGATLYLDEKDTKGIPTQFVTCTAGCFADVELKDSQLSALRAAKGPGRLEFADGSKKRLAVPIPFNGLSAAVDASFK